MVLSNVRYLGNLRTSSTHLKSKEGYITDAPIDNNGKGEAFSPTDLVATALANCMLTLIGIKSNDYNWNLTDMHATVEKEMSSDSPRRIIKISVHVYIMDDNLTDKDKTVIYNTAKNCPVAKSLHTDIEQRLLISYL